MKRPSLSDFASYPEFCAAMAAYKQQQNAVKLCVNCNNFFSNHGTCTAAQNVDGVNPVTGEVTWGITLAQTQRKHGVVATRLFNVCGEEGRWWVPIETFNEDPVEVTWVARGKKESSP